VTLGVYSKVFDTEIAAALGRIKTALGGGAGVEPIEEAGNPSSNDPLDDGSAADER
jgi:hypothetical protein